ncbi:hypothetical protein JRQ81_011590 [Phrynocephalus forsythii]|uniref:Ig-like domain-containing protein n=1 Tax=Phrynocephalus forsythii TaxID=171643 RepID=A0A9Q0X714_9SAUR|nr:hypothetical protein JRQ81_011590 [Phrynocephalus forsythii]
MVVLVLFSTWMVEFLVFSFLGLQCDLAKYTINVPDMVSVQEGLCVIIPCDFTYDPNDAIADSPLYGYWYEQGANADSNAAVATNNNQKRIEEYARGRFHLSEEVEHGNCSLIISDARRTDLKKYYFRMEQGPKAKFSYIKAEQNQPFVSVTELENPKIQMPEKLQAGHRVNITCIAPESCSWKRPHVSWEHLSHQVRSGIPAMQPNNPKDHISVFTFTPSVEDNGQELTCQVTYGEGLNPLHINETVRLNIHYPPQKLRISTEVMRSNKSLQNNTDSSQITVEKGDAVVLHCVVEGNPLPNMTWVKTLQPSGTLRLTSGNELRLLNVTTQDAGEYKCVAQNTEGFANTSVRLSLASNDASSQKVVNGVIGGLIVAGVIMLIIAAILVFKKFQRKRKTAIDLESYTKQKTVHNKSPPVFKEPNGIGLNHEEGKDVSEAQEKMEGGTEEIYSEPEEMYYASIIFNAQEAHPGVTSNSPPTEYAEIKKSQCTDFAGN